MTEWEGSDNSDYLLLIYLHSAVNYFTSNICVIYKLHITARRIRTNGDVLIS